jgi:hypothetical protein
MTALRRLLAISLLASVLAACGGAGTPPTPGAARGRTVSAGTADFTLAITAVVAGHEVQTNETGTVSFEQRRAHLYKLVPGQSVPQELILEGPYTYTNANVAAALDTPGVKPWTKLDTRRLTARQRRPDELAHVRAPAYLSDGVASWTPAGHETIQSVKLTRFRGEVDPRRLRARVPESIAAAVAADFPAGRFPADFWLDSAGRVRRVLVAYRTPGGTRITVDGGFSGFGDAVDLTLPAPGKIQDITP